MNNAKSFVEIQELINIVGPFFGYHNPFDFSKYAYTKHEGAHLQHLRVYKNRLHERGAHLDKTKFDAILLNVNALENYSQQLSFTVNNTTGSTQPTSGTLVFNSNTNVQIDYGNGIKIREKAYIIDLEFNVANNATKIVKIYFKNPEALISFISSDSSITEISSIIPLKNLLTVNLSSNKLVANVLNNIIIGLDYNNKSNGILNLESQANAEVSTAAAQITSLHSKGWTLTL